MRIQIWMLLFCVVSTSAWAAGAPTVEELAQIWEMWAPHTKTLEVEGFLFQGGGREGTPAVSREQILSLLEELQQLCESTDAPQIEDIRTITEPVFPIDPISGQSNGGWAAIHLIIDGNNSRVDNTLAVPPMQVNKDSESNQNTYTVTISRVDGKEVEYDSLNKQVSVRAEQGRFWMPSVSMFVLTVDEFKETQWTTERLEDDSYRYLGTNPRGRGEVLFETGRMPGFVSRRRITRGESVNERLQFNPIQMESGVVLSRLCSRQIFTGSRLGMLEIVIVKAAQVGIPVPEERFHVEAPPGTLVVSFPPREQYVSPLDGGPRPPMEKVTKSHSNASALAKEPGFGTPVTLPVISPPPTGSKWLYLINALIVITVLAYFLIARRSRAENTNRSH